MKVRNAFLMMAIVAFAAMGCETLDSRAQFKVEYEQNVLIEAEAAQDMPFEMVTDIVETDISAKMEANGSDVDKIEKVKLSSVQLSMVSPVEEDFSFLGSVEIYIIAEGLEERSIAFIDEVPEEIGDVIDAEVNDVELKQYLIKEGYQMKLVGTAAEELIEDHEVNIKTVFDVEAKVLGD